MMHQLIKRSDKTACGLVARWVDGTHICAAVTCPECKAWRDRLVDAVFTPLTETAPQKGQQ